MGLTMRVLHFRGWMNRRPKALRKIFYFIIMNMVCFSVSHWISCCLLQFVSNVSAGGYCRDFVVLPVLLDLSSEASDIEMGSIPSWQTKSPGSQGVSFSS